MELIEPYLLRTKISEGSDGLEIKIAPPLGWPYFLALLFGYGVAWFFAIEELTKHRAELMNFGIYPVALVGTLLASLAVFIYLNLRFFTGAALTVNRYNLALRRNWGGWAGLSKKIYPVSGIQKLTKIANLPVEFLGLEQNCDLAFAFDRKEVRIARYLLVPEADHILKIISQRTAS